MSDVEKEKINPRVFFTIDEDVLKKRKDQEPLRTEDGPTPYNPDWVTFEPGA